MEFHVPSTSQGHLRTNRYYFKSHMLRLMITMALLLLLLMMIMMMMMMMMIVMMTAKASCVDRYVTTSCIS